MQFAAFPDYTSATDTAEDAGLYELPLLPGDIIVAGTDGLWDNVQQDEIVKALPKDQSLMSQVIWHPPRSFGHRRSRRAGQLSVNR